MKKMTAYWYKPLVTYYYLLFWLGSNICQNLEPRPQKSYSKNFVPKNQKMKTFLLTKFSNECSSNLLSPQQL